MKKRLECIMFADCQQFNLEDNCREDIPAWSRREENHRLLSVEEQSISVGTVTDSLVRIALKVVDGRPHDEDFTAWDQVNECTLMVPSGRIVLREVGDFSDDRGIYVSPGEYRVRIYYGKLGSLPSSAWNPQEHYKIVLWEAVSAPIVGLKCRLCEGACWLTCKIV
jgi:hypothetical protein